MELILTPEVIFSAIVIFVLRLVNYSISTIRLVFIARDMRWLSAATAFLEALIFAVVMAQVLTEINNILTLGAYCLGAAAGSYAGQWLEARFVVSYSTVTIITRDKGKAIAESLHNHNYGATLSYGEGRDGEVAIVRSSATNRDIPALLKIVKTEYPNAFIQVEAARTLQRGYIPGGPPRRA